MCGRTFDDLHLTVRQRLCEALYAAGRKKDPGEALLEMVNTLDEEVYSSKSITKWVSGESIPYPFVWLHAFNTSLQTLPIDVSPLQKVMAMQSRPQLW